MCYLVHVPPYNYTYPDYYQVRYLDISQARLLFTLVQMMGENLCPGEGNGVAYCTHTQNLGQEKILLWMSVNKGDT